MITNNAPLPNAFTNEEPKYNFGCYKRIQPCFLKQYIREYRKFAVRKNSTFFNNKKLEQRKWTINMRI
jgi:hypothetical protein